VDQDLPDDRLIPPPHDVYVCGIDYKDSCAECRKNFWPEGIEQYRRERNE